MKSTLSFLSICVTAIIGICAFSTLPDDNSAIVKEKYNDWTGVIRIWVCDEIKPTPLTWLNSCAADYEKTVSGTYISIQRTTASAITHFAESGINPPDMIIWQAGLLDSTEGLHEITGEFPVRSGLVQSAYAVPILTDAYAWIYDPAEIPAIPADMYDIPVVCRGDDLIAMTALSSGKRSAGSIKSVIPGVDLGLSGESPAPEMDAGNIVCRASSSLTVTGDPVTALREGDSAAAVGNISEITALYSEGYKALVTGDHTYTGAPVLCSVIEKDVSSAEERRARCEDFITYLMSEGQKKAHLSGLMPAAEGVAAYAGDPVLSYIEAQLAGLECISPPYFGSAPEYESARLFTEGKLTADEAIEMLQ